MNSGRAHQRATRPFACNSSGSVRSCESGNMLGNIGLECWGPSLVISMMDQKFNSKWSSTSCLKLASKIVCGLILWNEVKNRHDISGKCSLMFGRLLPTDRAGPQAVSNGIEDSPPFSFIHNDWDFNFFDNFRVKTISRLFTNFSNRPSLFPSHALH